MLNSRVARPRLWRARFTQQRRYNLHGTSSSRMPWYMDCYSPRSKDWGMSFGRQRNSIS